MAAQAQRGGDKSQWSAAVSLIVQLSFIGTVLGATGLMVMVLMGWAGPNTFQQAVLLYLFAILMSIEGNE